MCSFDDGERATVWTETQHTARKPHECASCGRTIAVGERYVRHRSMYEGSWWSEACCLPCDADRHEFARADGHMLTVPSSFPYDLDNCVDGFDHNDPWRPMLNRLRERAGRTAVECHCEGCVEPAPERASLSEEARKDLPF